MKELQAYSSKVPVLFKILHMKKLILSIVMLMSFSSFAKECESRNHIFLIHGIGGDEKTFGVMDQYLEKINPCYKVTAFTYNTGISDLSTGDFANHLNVFIEGKMLENGFDVNDKISFIMHSQGGIVGSLWLLKTRMERPDLYKKFDAFITLSTPYWGSTMAIIGKRFFFTLPPELDNPIAPVGRLELRDMSFGSPTMKMMQENFEQIYGNGTHVRFLAVGGLKRDYNAEYGEDDTTVSVYSSRPDHYALQETFDPSSENNLSESAFKFTNNIIPFVPVTATHFKIEIPGVAKIEDKCLKRENCKHPSIDHIVRHLDGEAPQVDPEFVFRKYRVQMYLTGWEGKIEDKDEVILSLVKPHGETEDVDFSIKRNAVLHATFSGILKNTEEHKINLKLKIKGKVVREFNAPVKGGFTTFLNLQMSSDKNQ